MQKYPFQASLTASLWYDLSPTNKMHHPDWELGWGETIENSPREQEQRQGGWEEFLGSTHCAGPEVLLGQVQHLPSGDSSLSLVAPHWSTAVEFQPSHRIFRPLW